MPARPKPKARRDDGPDLPWPCWTIRLYAAGKTTAELEQLGRDRGVALTPKQRRQARACLR
ncbi:hypothetical protein RA307_23645 [Xanthobacteraceae bacterium Astr-EGSB]|uniref:hypothetical protein n=1 Tax=Astrobacterium formosum TaxID=3069710 RepID=UPI0027AE2294|nr:hypothetical protein [Xanthobacteraceae bacterium Astr-EGSB]